MSKERDEVVKQIKREAGFDMVESSQYANGYLAAKANKPRAFKCPFWLAGWHDYHIQYNTGVYS